MPLMETVRPNGAEIRRRRQHLGWNTVQFAKLVETGQSWLSQIELGNADPSAALYGRICNKLGAQWDDLLYTEVSRTSASQDVA